MAFNSILENIYFAIFSKYIIYKKKLEQGKIMSAGTLKSESFRKTQEVVQRYLGFDKQTRLRRI